MTVMLFWPLIERMYSKLTDLLMQGEDLISRDAYQVVLKDSLNLELIARKHNNKILVK